MNVKGKSPFRGPKARSPRGNPGLDNLAKNDVLADFASLLEESCDSPEKIEMQRTAHLKTASTQVLSRNDFVPLEQVAVGYLRDQYLLKFCDPADKAGAKARSDAAIQKFMLAEERCRLTNIRLSSAFKPIFQDGIDCGTIFMIACRKIAELLRVCNCEKECNCISVETNSFCDFGPGGTTSRSKRQGDKSLKFVGNNECTSGNLALAVASINARPLWLKGLLQEKATIVINNRDKITTVPKNSKIDRVICSQPDLNVFTQKGFGQLIRRRLKRVGVDLDSQTLNQDFAQVGSLFENLATIDLSMASDTVAYMTVLQLLPVDWFLALEQCRVPETVLPCGSVHTYHKFSAMGNGYTFELESLLFWALVSSCVEALALEDQRVAIYGDDIICPVGAVPLVRDVLDYCGFSFNSDKSFWDSPFRESCGKHFFEGVDVSPFYVRGPITDVSTLFLLHNNAWRWVVRCKWFLSSRVKTLFWRFLDRLKDLVPHEYKKCRVFDGFGDGGLVGTFDFVRPRLARDFLDGYLIKVIALIPRVSNRSTYYGWLCKSLDGIEKTRYSMWTYPETSTLPPVTGGLARVVEIFIPRSAMA